MLNSIINFSVKQKLIIGLFTIFSIDESLKLIGINSNRFNEDNISKRVSVTSPIDG